MIKYSDLVRNRGQYIEYLDRRRYRLKDDLRYWIDYDHQNEYIDIPAWYEFDFNSSPCFAHCIVDRDEFCISLIHDYLYSREGKVTIKNIENYSELFTRLKKHSTGVKVYWNDSGQHYEFLYTQKWADLIWLYGAREEAEEITRVRKKWKTLFGYIALRFFWGKSFKK